MTVFLSRAEAQDRLVTLMTGGRCSPFLAAEAREIAGDILDRAARDWPAPECTVSGVEVRVSPAGRPVRGVRGEDRFAVTPPERRAGRGRTL
jgi:hypothetical protein